MHEADIHLLSCRLEDLSDELDQARSRAYTQGCIDAADDLIKSGGAPLLNLTVDYMHYLNKVILDQVLDVFDQLPPDLEKYWREKDEKGLTADDPRVQSWITGYTDTIEREKEDRE